jgi:dTDP-glucose 4,6-dehydratase
MRLIVTAGAGFIGSAVVCSAVKAGHEVLTIDKLTYAGRREALAEVMGFPSHRRAGGVRRDERERHLRPSRSGEPTVVAARRGATRPVPVPPRVHGRGFGTLGETGRFDERSRYAPNSPYAASKAASDHFARAWHHTYGLPVIVTNCSNNFGPRQHAEKLIPTVIRHSLDCAPIPIYGSGANTRDWLYVEDHVSGLLAALRQGKPGDTYLFGGRCELCNIDLATKICDLLETRSPRSDGKPYAQQLTFVADRPGHDFRYAIDPSHAEATLGWAAKKRLEQGLAATVDWYLANSNWLISVSELGRLGMRRAGSSPAPQVPKAQSS